MSAAKHIAELERELAEQWAVLNRASARIRGIEAELAHLRAGTALVGDLSGVPLTDAIVAVLRASPTVMTPTGIGAALKERGRETEANTRTATLSHLARKGRARREGRGAWRAI